MNGVWTLQKGDYEGAEICQRGLYVWNMLHIPIQGKVKRQCLETAINNTRIWKNH